MSLLQIKTCLFGLFLRQTISCDDQSRLKTESLFNFLELIFRLPNPMEISKGQIKSKPKVLRKLGVEALFATAITEE